MGYLTNKLKSRFRTLKESDLLSSPIDTPSPTNASPTYKQRRFSLFQPRVRTDFSPSEPLGIIESPQQSPESPYSGIPKIGELEVVTRVAKGEVTAVRIVTKNATATNKEPVLKRQRSIDAGAMLALTANEARLDYSDIAGLLFSAVVAKSETKQDVKTGHTTLRLSAGQAMKLRQAVAVNRELAYYRKRTMRETRLLNTYQETLNSQLQPLESQFETWRASSDSDLTADQLAIQKGIVRIREDIAEADRERAVVEKKLQNAREGYEQFSQTALALLASLLEEQVLADKEVMERQRSEARFAKRFTVPEGWLGQ